MKRLALLLIILVLFSTSVLAFRSAIVPSSMPGSGGTTEILNGTINETWANGTYIKQTDEPNLNVNSSTWWSGLSGWVNDWFIQTGNDLDFNETKLEEKINTMIAAFNATLTDTDTHVAGDDVYLYNDSTTMYFNETKLNTTINSLVSADYFKLDASNGPITGNVSVSLTSGDAEFKLDSGANMDSCFVLQESNTHGFNFCYDGSGLNNWIVTDLDGNLRMQITRDEGEVTFYNHTEIQGNLDVTTNLTATNYFSGDGSQGITDATSYWLCTSADCSTTCQVSVKDGLIVGCS